MAITTVQHIANVSFKDHFLGTNGTAHRAAGKAEIDLKSKLNHLLKCVEHYGGIAPATFFHKPGEEVQA